MVIDDQVYTIDLPAEVVRLDVHHRDPVEVVHVRRCHDLDLNIEQVHHPLVLGPGDPLERGNDRRLPVAAEHVPQCQATGEGIGIGIVVEEDQDAIGVTEEPLILLDLEAGERAAELGEKWAAEEFRERQVIEFGKLRLEFLFAFARVGCANPQHVHQRATGIPDGLEHFAQALPAVVLDDDACARCEVGFVVGIRALEVAEHDV